MRGAVMHTYYSSLLISILYWLGLWVYKTYNKAECYKIYNFIKSKYNLKIYKMKHMYSRYIHNNKVKKLSSFNESKYFAQQMSFYRHTS